MKNFICSSYIFIFLFVIILSVNGHASEDESEVPVVAYSGMFQSVDYWVKLAKGISEKVSDKNAFLLDFTNNSSSHENQTSAIILAARHQANGFILGPISDDIENSISMLEEADIPLVLVNTDLNHPWVQSAILTDNWQASVLAAKHLHQKISQKNSSANTVVIISGDKMSVDARIRANAALSYFESVGGYRVNVFYAEQWGGKKALEIAHKQLSLMGDDIIGMYSTFAPGSIALTVAAKETNTNPVLMGFDLNDAMKELIKQGDLIGSVVQNPEGIGKKSVETLFSIMEKQPVDRRIYIPSTLITEKDL